MKVGWASATGLALRVPAGHARGQAGRRAVSVSKWWVRHQQAGPVPRQALKHQQRVVLVGLALGVSSLARKASQQTATSGTTP
jgi:hypothetical protein